MDKKSKKLDGIDTNWLKEQVQQKSVRRIASELSCTYSTLYWKIKELEIEIPKRSNYFIVCDKSKIAQKAYKKKYPDGRFGKNAANWQGGIRKYNYIFVYEPTSFSCLARKSRYIQEHILIAEKTLGRLLKKDEIVHHIDGNKHNNDLKNLEVLKKADHVKRHFEAVKDLILYKQYIKKLELILQQNNIKFEKQQFNNYGAISLSEMISSSHKI